MMFKKSIIVAISFLYSSSLLADQFHYTNFIIGERAMGLGGAYTAVADDASGVFYNPAGLGFALNSDISGSANAYYSKETVYKDAIGDNDFKESASGTANPFFGGLQKLDHIWRGLAAGFAVYVTDNEFKDQDDLLENIDFGSGVSLDRYHRTANTRSETLGVALAAAKKFKGGFSVGASLSYLNATELTQNYQDVQQTLSASQQVYSTVNVRESLNVDALETAIGAQYAFWNLSVGVNLKFRSIIKQNIEYANDTTSYQEPISQDPTRQNVSYNYDDALEEWPNEYRFGLAWFATTRLLLTFDTTYHTGVEEPAVSGSTAEELIKNYYQRTYARQATTNFAGGLEYYITSSVPVRVGVFTNNDARKEVEAGQTNQADHIDYMGYSLFFAWVQPNSQVSFGVVYQDGKGEAQKIADSESIQDVTSSAYTIAISATHSL